jgi:hypothetical protein
MLISITTGGERSRPLGLFGGSHGLWDRFSSIARQNFKCGCTSSIDRPFIVLTETKPKNWSKHAGRERAEVLKPKIGGNGQRHFVLRKLPGQGLVGRMRRSRALAWFLSLRSAP